MLHGKVLETLAAEVEQETTPEAITEAIVGWKFPHRLRDVVSEVSRELSEIEERRVMLTGEKARDMYALVRGKLTEKLQGVRFVRNIPESLTVTAQEIAPELVSQRETLGTVEIPGVGRRLPQKQHARFGFDQVPTVALSVEEFRQVESWPLPKVYPVLSELGDREQLDYSLQRAMEAPEAERLGALRAFFAQRWLEFQRGNYPKDVPITSPRQADLPQTPAPVEWGFDLLTGEPFTAYPALTKRSRYGSEEWMFCWHTDAAQAAKADTEARREAESYITARRLEAELAASAKAVELPAPVPAPYAAPTYTPEEILAMAGFTSDQYRIRTDVGYWYSRGWSGRRDPYDGEWCEGRGSSGCFAQKANDGVWEIGQSGLTHLFEGGSVGDYQWQAFAKPVLAEMGAGEKIAAIQAELQAKLEASQEAYRANVRTLARALQALPAFASLSSDMQAKLSGLASVSSGTPKVDEAELRLEWANMRGSRRARLWPTGADISGSWEPRATPTTG